MAPEANTQTDSTAPENATIISRPDGEYVTIWTDTREGVVYAELSGHDPDRLDEDAAASLLGGLYAQHALASMFGDEEVATHYEGFIDALTRAATEVGFNID